MGPAEAKCRQIPRKSTVVFAASVKHISSLVSAFKEIAGVDAVGIHGGTPKSERADIIDRFNQGGCKKISVSSSSRFHLFFVD